MKKKACRGLSFTCVVILLFGIMNHTYETHDIFYATEGGYRYENMPQNLQIVSFGNSHSLFSIDYDLYPQWNGFSFAFPLQMPYMDAKVMKSYQENFADDCVVLLSVSYFSFSMEYEKEYERQLRRYYRVLDIDLIPDVTFEKLVLYRWLPILSAQKEVVDVFAPPAFDPELYRFTKQFEGTDEEWFLYAQFRASTHMGLVENGTLESQALQMEGMREMIDTCLENGWTPVLITPPYTSQYNRAVPEEQKEFFYTQIDTLLAEYPELSYYDFSADERISNNLAYFYDCDHLREEGREVFTHILIETLQEDFILPKEIDM